MMEPGIEHDNSPMIVAWDGEVGQRWVTDQARHERMHAPFGSTLLAAAQLRTGMRVLDAGCGTGDRTIDAATTVGPHGRVVGVDIASPMLEVARRRSVELGLDNARFIRADIQTSEDLGFEEFDLALSQFGVMFFADTWSYAACSLADPKRTQALLANAGFADIEVQPTVAPMFQGSDLNDALRFLRRGEFGGAVFGDSARPPPPRAGRRSQPPLPRMCARTAYSSMAPPGWSPQPESDRTSALPGTFTSSASPRGLVPGAVRARPTVSVLCGRVDPRRRLSR